MPSEVRFAVIRRILERAGWTLKHVKGSHHVFVKAGERPIIIPVHRNRVSPTYVKEVEKVVGKN